MFYGRANCCGLRIALKRAACARERLFPAIFGQFSFENNIFHVYPLTFKLPTWTLNCKFKVKMCSFNFDMIITSGKVRSNLAYN